MNDASEMTPDRAAAGTGQAPFADDDEAPDTGAIAWLLPEIVAAFDAATAALRAFRAGAAGVARHDVDLAPLRIARSHVHQAHGALELGELAGVPKVTEAIEDLLASFEAEPGRCDATALDAVIGGCRAIVEYLEDVQGGERPQPLRLFPSYRDLLAARRVDRIHPADLFSGELRVRAPATGGGAPLDAVGLREQRATFEQGLLRYLRSDSDPAALATLTAAVIAIDASVAAHPAQGQHRAYWWVTRAFFEALQHGGFAQVPAQRAHLKRLAGRVNLQIRKLVDGSAIVAERLFNDTLFFVALAAPVTSHVREVKARYRLDRAVPPDFEVQRYGRIDTLALRAAREALAAAKAAWSAIVAGDVGQIPCFARNTGALVEAVGPVKRRGLTQVAQVIDGIATDLGFDPRRPTHGVGLDVATALLFLESSLDRARMLDEAFDGRAALVVARVEATVLGHEAGAAPVDWLDRLSRQAEERLTLAAFVAELHASLQNAEKILDAFFRDPSDRKALKDARRSLSQAGGALSLLGHDEAQAAIARAGATIERFERDPALVDPDAFEQLARSLGAVGFYVEQIKRERIDRDAFHFDAVTGNFSADMARAPARSEAPPDLSWSVDVDAASTGDSTPAVADRVGDPAFAATDLVFAATEVLEPGATIEEEIAIRAADAQDRMARLREQPDDATARTQLVAAIDDVRRNAMLIDDRELQDEAASVLAVLRDGDQTLGFASAAELGDRVTELAIHANRAVGAGAPFVLPSAPALPVPAADNVEAIDAELLEIFLEEAGGVLEDADASMRVLDADPHSTTATANLRRGFHTLKGSGRMVGLTAFGDAAWSIEDALNGHIADQRPASADLRALVDYAIRYLSDWVGELRTAGTSARIPDALIEAAKAVRHDAAEPRPGAARGDDEAPAAVLLSQPPAPSGEEDAFFAATLVLDDAFDGAGGESPLAAPQAPVDDDPSFAATEVLDDAAEVPELQFFGVQPHDGAPSSAPPIFADAASTVVEEPLEEPDFSGFSLEGPTVDAERPEPAHGDAPFEADRLEQESSSWPLDTADDLSLGFATDTVVSAGTDDEDAVAFDSEPVEAAPADSTDASEAVVPAGSTASADVLSFPVDRPAVPAGGDEVRRIGSLTLSVALFNIYLTEADELLRVLTQDFSEWRHELERNVSEDALRAVHSLAGSSATVGLVVAHDLAAGIEDVLQALWRAPVALRGDQVEQLRAAVESLRKMLHRFAAERLPEPDPVRLAGLLALRREVAGDEARETTEVPVDAYRPEVAVVDGLPFEPLDFGDAASVPAVPQDTREDVVARDVEADRIEPEPVDDDVAPTADRSAPVESPPASVEADRVDFVAADLPSAEAEPSSEDAAPTELPQGIARETIDASVRALVQEPLAGPLQLHDEIDPDLLEVFVAEGGEILPQIGALLRTWQSRPGDAAPARTLLRHLHTLKGSARMAGAMRLGEVVHDLEARVESAARLHEVPSALVDDLLASHDRSLELFDRLQQPAAAEIADVQPAGATIPDAMPAVHGGGARVAPDARAKDASSATKPAVRVDSETLDRLVNLAGEVSISRARIENEVQQIKGAMSELNDNVERLRAQLREIELQAEFQMQSQMQSQQAAGEEREKFDPLEFDRFTRFQELTRMMAESVNDVKTLQTNLQRSLDTAEGDLASQRRMTRDLQQDLMRVRMVPFSSIAERLYRVVRRAAKEVDKRVNLDIRGGSVEIDRSVLERMAGPFEHLLRNHIVHGIESREGRQAAGKDETGELLVEVRQEGNEIVLAFSDDGAGLDHDRIRTKGRALGLIGDGIADAEVAELIFHPGFSTATEVTELAGRGVGMDVVREEATVLAGRVSVDSTRGRGTRFTINLPLTLAITQVVLVRLAGRIQALPAVLVEQVQQLRPQPLAEAYRAGTLASGDAQVRLMFLGALLGLDDAVPVAQKTSPVLILRSGGERLAIHVDEVIGNQEVVVKNLGPQLARMTGIAGATVLGSGQIVLILNPVQLAQGVRPDEVRVPTVVDVDDDETSPGRDLKTLPTVMVVDDSLTVRRVTQRLLSREGYQVVLAKDGVDALEQLQDFAPDAMLVDIEMPRMDGFDLTRNVRNDDRYRHIPIIMITSRTAEKHRLHAAELGVDAYLGKPYGEDELLELLAMHTRSARAHPA